MAKSITWSALQKQLNVFGNIETARKWCEEMQKEENAREIVNGSSVLVMVATDKEKVEVAGKPLTDHFALTKLADSKLETITHKGTGLSVVSGKLKRSTKKTDILAYAQKLEGIEGIDWSLSDSSKLMDISDEAKGSLAAIRADFNSINCPY